MDKGVGFKFQVSGFKFQVSGFKFQVSGFGFEKSKINPELNSGQKSKIIGFFLFFIVFSFYGYGQTRLKVENLVPNPSFERNRACPRYNESIRHVVGWERSHIFSADYFHYCVNPFQQMNLGMPRNMFGFQYARTGDAYAGISFCNEVLTARLTRPLVKDSIYKVEFFVNLADSSNVATRFMGMYISNREIRYVQDNWELISQFILDHPPQIINPPDNYLDDKENWTSINGLYTAKGGEQFITIGGFYPYHDSLVHVFRASRPLRNVYRGWERHLGYYYVDDVSVIPYGMNWQVEVNYVLRHVYFDFDEMTLLDESVDELTRLSAHLKKHPTYNISIRGHTDNFGTDEYNNLLAINRAMAVVEWLIFEGDIDPERIVYSGAGRSEPIADNETEEGRSLNRRVEFILTENIQVPSW